MMRCMDFDDKAARRRLVITKCQILSPTQHVLVRGDLFMWEIREPGCNLYGDSPGWHSGNVISNDQVFPKKLYIQSIFDLVVELRF